MNVNAQDKILNTFTNTNTSTSTSTSTGVNVNVNAHEEEEKRELEDLEEKELDSIKRDYKVHMSYNDIKHKIQSKSNSQK